MTDINRRTFLSRSMAAAAMAALPNLSRAVGTTQHSTQGRRRPNLIYVFADQMRASACAYRDGADPVLTPNLDRFAKQGTTLTHAYSSFPVCSPYRGQLLTGCYPNRSGITTNCWSHNPGLELRQADVCFTDVLNRSGYDVGYIGKWHLESPRQPYVMAPGPDGAMWNEYTPPARRHGITYWHAFNDYDNHFNPEYWIGDAPRDRRTAIHQFAPEYEANVAISFLRNDGGHFRDPAKPFALFVSHNPPHTPYGQVPPKYVAMYGDATPAELLTRGNVDLNSDHPNAKAGRKWAKDYFALVSAVDDQFGRLLAEVDRLGLADDTLVVFTADHGDMMGSHNRMAKTVWYDESARVPFIARWPGQLRAGALDDLLITPPDIAPTLLNALGIDSPADWEGRNYADALRGAPGAARPDSAYYICNPLQARGVRTHRHCYVVAHKLPTAGPEAGPEGPVQLYDSQEDPFQTRNVAGERPGVEAELREALHGWLGRTRDPFAV